MGVLLGRTLTSAQSEYLKLTSTFPIRPPVSKVDEDEEMEDASDSATSAPAAKKQRRDSSSEAASSTSGVDGAVSSNGSENGTAPVKSVAAPLATSQQNPLLPVKRKRGRPTKAESEARKAAQLRGEALPPKAPSYTPVATPVYTVGPDGVQRRRRGRPSKAEVAARKAAEAEAAGVVTAPGAVLAPPVAAMIPAPPPTVKSDAS